MNTSIAKGIVEADAYFPHASDPPKIDGCNDSASYVKFIDCIAFAA